MKTRRVALGAALAFGVASCASSSGMGPAAPSSGVAGTAVDLAGGPAPQVAGTRCKNGRCTCRAGRDNRELAPPPEGSKRFEIRVWADGGKAVLKSAELGVFGGGGPEPTCYYVDIPEGSKQEVQFVAMEGQTGGGIAPGLSIAEYGPTQPADRKGDPAYWYDILKVGCSGQNGRCDRWAADDWAKTARQRKRGRLDPCGSTVISHLEWETTGGLGDRDGGYFRDFTVKFGMEVKRFPTQFAPGATECVPK